MKAICFYFQIHQPFRLKKYRFFNIGNDHYYYDDFADEDVVTRIANRSYIPAAKTLLKMIQDSKGAFRCAISVSGLALEQFQTHVPELIDLFRKLAETGKVDFIAETYGHSLASIADPEEFRHQVEDHARLMYDAIGVKPTVFRNTELIYCDELAPQILSMGYKGVITEGAKHILGWKSPNYVYAAAEAPELKMLLKNDALSDRITADFRTNPFTAEQFLDTIAATPKEEEIINLFMPMETMGELHPADTGIFQFMEALPKFAAERNLSFITPTEACETLPAVATLAIPHYISWADEARDISAWLGNDLQNEAFNKLYSVAERVRLCSDRRIKQDWNRLQAADNFFYMSTKRRPDGSINPPFSPYETPFEAFTNYMNILGDFLVRVEEQYPLTIENEELNSLLTTIRNQSGEIEKLNKELASMRNSVEHYNEERRARAEEAEIEEVVEAVLEVEKKKAAPKKAAPKKTAKAKEEKAEAPKKEKAAPKKAAKSKKSE